MLPETGPRSVRDRMFIGKAILGLAHRIPQCRLNYLLFGQKTLQFSCRNLSNFIRETEMRVDHGKEMLNGEWLLFHLLILQKVPYFWTLNKKFAESHPKPLCLIQALLHGRPTEINVILLMHRASSRWPPSCAKDPFGYRR